jgi:AcrR family transcriptional regulator
MNPRATAKAGNTKVPRHAASTDVRADRVRQAIKAAAFGLAQLRRIEDISVTDLVARAEVSRQAFYNHFVDRDDAVFQAVRDSMESALTEIVRDSPADRPSKADNERITAQLMVWMSDHSVLVRNLTGSGVSERLVEYTRDLARVMTEAALERINTPMPPLTRWMVTEYVVGGSVGLMWAALDVSPPLSAAQYIRVLEALFPGDSTVLRPAEMVEDPQA